MRYGAAMRVRHKGLRALHERGDPARLPAGLLPRLRRILFRLQEVPAGSRVERNALTPRAGTRSSGGFYMGNPSQEN